MRHLIPRILWAHRKTSAAAFVALLGASALLTALGIVLQSGLGSGVSTQRYAAATAVVGGDRTVNISNGDKTRTKPFTEETTLPASLAGRLAEVNGVHSAIGEINVPTAVVGQDGSPLRHTSLGHGWSSAALAPFRLTHGRPPADAGEVVLDKDLAEQAKVQVNDMVSLVTAAGVTRHRVVGVVNSASSRQSTLFFTDPEAARLSGTPDRIHAVGILAEPGFRTDSLNKALKGTGAVVSTGDARARAEFPDVGRARVDLQELAGTLGAAVVLVTVLVVAGTLTLTLHQRRREFALLRAVAATPRQITQLIAGETLIVSLTAGLAGILPGIALAFLIKTTLTEVGVIPGDFDFTVGPIPMLAAVFACVAVAELAAYAAGRRTARLDPVTALGSAAAPSTGIGAGRAVLGWALFLLGTAATALPLIFDGIFPVVGAGTGGLVMVIAAVLLAPPLVRAATRLAAPLLRSRFGAEGYLAAASAVAGSRRLASAIAPLILAVGFSCVQLFIPTTMAAGASRDVREGVTADYVLSADPIGVPSAAVEEIRRVPGVRTATRVSTTTVYASVSMLGDPEVFDYQALGADPRDLADTLDPGVRSGSTDDLGPDTVALSRMAAGTLRASVGERIHLYLGDGTALTPRVVAVYDRGLGFGDILLPHETVTAHTSDHRTDLLLVRSEGDIAAELSTLATQFPCLKVADSDTYTAAQQQQFSLTLFTSALPLLVVFGYLVIAVTNILAATIAGRCREFALLRLIGTTPRQILRMVGLEAAFVVSVAVVVGSAVPALPLITISYGLTGSLLPSAPLLLYLAIVGVVSAVGTAALLIPTRLALRTEPITAIGNRE